MPRRLSAKVLPQSCVTSRMTMTAHPTTMICLPPSPSLYHASRPHVMSTSFAAPSRASLACTPRRRAPPSASMRSAARTRPVATSAHLRCVHRRHVPVTVSTVSSAPTPSLPLSSTLLADLVFAYSSSRTPASPHLCSLVRWFITSVSLCCKLDTGITCPRSGKDGEKEDFADEATAFTKSRVYQHDVRR